MLLFKTFYNCVFLTVKIYCIIVLLLGVTNHLLEEAAQRSNSTSKQPWLRRCKRAKRSYSTFKVRRGGREEILLIQGERNPSKTAGVARGHQRAGTLKS